MTMQTNAISFRSCLLCGTSETAREKNVALAEAGAIVPPTFDKFGTSSLSHPAKLRTMS